MSSGETISYKRNPFIYIPPYLIQFFLYIRQSTFKATKLFPYYNIYFFLGLFDPIRLLSFSDTICFLVCR